MQYVLLVCQLGLALVLLLAATGKLINSEQFRAALRLSKLPSGLDMPISLLVPSVEVLLAGALVLAVPRFLPAVLVLTTLLFSLFTAWIFSVYVQGMKIKCGCFGTGDSDIGLRTL
ncbi:MAG: MauE/DoxX family redox-associated membrane protein, partial [Ktedonobacterales bacterium]